MELDVINDPSGRRHRVSESIGDVTPCEQTDVQMRAAVDLPPVHQGIMPRVRIDIVDLIRVPHRGHAVEDAIAHLPSHSGSSQRVGIVDDQATNDGAVPRSASSGEGDTVEVVDISRVDVHP